MKNEEVATAWVCAAILHSSFFTLHLTTFLIFFGTDGHGFFKDTAFFIRHGKHGLTRIFLVRVITRCRVLPRVRPLTAKPPLELSVLHEVIPNSSFPTSPVLPSPRLRFFHLSSQIFRCYVSSLSPYFSIFVP